MDYHHRDSHSSATPINYSPPNVPASRECRATAAAERTLKNVVPRSTRGHEAQSFLGNGQSARASSRRLLLFQWAAKRQLNLEQVARFPTVSARAPLLCGLLALLGIASPHAWSQTIAWQFTASHEANGSPAIG